MHVTASGDRVTKVAETPGEQTRLRLEERLLRAVAHPGVVAVAGSDWDTSPFGSLTLTRPSGPGLADVGDQPAEAVAGWAAALATTVADLHDLGCFHRAISAEHVSLEATGRPVLGGFDAAVAAGDGEEQRELARADTAALAALVASRLPDGVDRRLLGLLERARTGRRRRPTARDLATALVELVPGARIEPAAAGEQMVGSGAGPVGEAAGGAEPAPPRAPRPRKSGPARAFGVAAGLATVGAAAVLIAGPGPAGHGPPGARRTATRLPAAPGPGWLCPVGPTCLPGPVVAVAGPGGHFRLHAAPGEEPVVVVGRWACGPARPAVLDRRTGSVWVLPYWPAPGQRVSGRLVAVVDGATGVAGRPGGPGCDVLRAQLGDGTAVAVATGADR